MLGLAAVTELAIMVVWMFLMGIVHHDEGCFVCKMKNAVSS